MIQKAILGYEGLYDVTSEGNIISLPKSTSGGSIVMKTYLNNSGYVCVPLCRDGLRKSHTVHSIVARSFVGDRPKGYDIDHINGDKLDNRVINLRYITHRENMQNAVRNGFNNKGSNSSFAKLDDDKVISIRMEDGRLSDISDRYGVSVATISRIRARKIWKHVL